jgi:hypothetical protein
MYEASIKRLSKLLKKIKAISHKIFQVGVFVSNWYVFVHEYTHAKYIHTYIHAYKVCIVHTPQALENAKGALGKKSAEEMREELWREEEAFLTLPTTFFDFLKGEATFINKLIQISQDLISVAVPSRLPVLKQALEGLNHDFPATVYIPLCSATDVSFLSVCTMCVCVYIYIYIYVCMYVYIFTSTTIPYVCVCVYIYIYIYTHTHIHTHVAWVWLCPRVYLC